MKNLAHTRIHVCIEQIVNSGKWWRILVVKCSKNTRKNIINKYLLEF